VCIISALEQAATTVHVGLQRRKYKPQYPSAVYSNWYHRILLLQALQMRREYASQTGAPGPRAVVFPTPLCRLFGFACGTRSRTLS